MVVAEKEVTSDFVNDRDLPAASNGGTKIDVRLAGQPTKVDKAEDSKAHASDLNKILDQDTNGLNEGKELTAEESSPSNTKETADVVGDVPAAEDESEEEIAQKGNEAKEQQANIIEVASDADLLAQAEEHVREERLLEGARVLRKVVDKSLLKDKHRRALEKAEHIEAAVVNLTSSPDEGWTKQGESHGNYDTIIYYKVDEATRLTARIETPIEASLLVPLLSVFNESELYESCLPHFQGLGISRSTKLRQTGRGNQIIAVNSYMPWPLADREAVIEATAVDDISTNNYIVVKMETRYTGEEDGLIPPPQKGVVRVDFDGGILFRKCPEDHPAFAKSKHPDHEGPLVQVCLTMFVDAHVQYVPQSLINFITRTALGRMWAGLLEVAEGIRDGKRPQHAEAIAAKRNLYEWVEQRVGVMIDGMHEADAEATAA